MQYLGCYVAGNEVDYFEKQEVAMVAVVAVVMAGNQILNSLPITADHLTILEMGKPIDA